MGEKLYTEAQMYEATKFGWFHGGDDAKTLRDGFEKWLSIQAVPAPQPDKALVEEINRWAMEYGYTTYPDDEKALARRLADRFGGWVSVEERLPGEDLVWVGSVSGNINTTGYYEHEKWWNDEGFEFGEPVTHWRPLPAPPEVK